jgi:hypothetical protein
VATSNINNELKEKSRLAIIKYDVNNNAAALKVV